MSICDALCESLLDAVRRWLSLEPVRIGGDGAVDLVVRGSNVGEQRFDRWFNNGILEVRLRPTVGADDGDSDGEDPRSGGTPIVASRGWWSDAGGGGRTSAAAVGRRRPRRTSAAAGSVGSRTAAAGRGDSRSRYRPLRARRGGRARGENDDRWGRRALGTGASTTGTVGYRAPWERSRFRSRNRTYWSAA